MLNYWGSIIVEQYTMGFAMEFIGDVANSTMMAGMSVTKGTNVGGR